MVGANLIFDMTFLELAVAIKEHIASCDQDHSSFSKQIPLIDFNPAFETLTCQRCTKQVRLDVPASFGGDLEIYLCRLMKQQKKFFDEHFKSCVNPTPDNQQPSTEQE